MPSHHACSSVVFYYCLPIKLVIPLSLHINYFETYMEKKAPLKLVVILLSLSYVVYVAAVPATRSPMAKKVDPYHQAKEGLVMDLMKNEEHFGMKEGVEEGRMTMDVSDYPGTGPNHRHDPKSPGKA